MKLSSRKVKNIMVIVLTGELDIDTVEAFESDIESYLGDAKQYILNLHGVNFISSAGIQEIYQLYQRIQSQDGSLVICAPQSEVDKVFRIVSLYEDIPYFSTEEEAVTHYGH